MPFHLGGSALKKILDELLPSYKDKIRKQTFNILQNIIIHFQAIFAFQILFDIVVSNHRVSQLILFYVHPEREKQSPNSTK